MEKLIKLLNEFNKEKGWHPGLLYEGFGVRKGDLNFIFNHSKFPFIKWLVDNDKIDKKKIDTRLVKSVESHYDEEGYWVENSYEDYSDTDTLLMLLAISSSPIDDLISYLR